MNLIRPAASRLTLALIVLISCILVCTGCSYLGFYTRKAHWQKTFDRLPSMSILGRLAPEDSLVLGGPIVKRQPWQEPLLLLALSSQYRQDEKVSLVQIQASQEDYMAFLPKGEYELLVFADLDHNGSFERHELVGETSASVGIDRSRDGVNVVGPPVTVDFLQPERADFRVSVRVRPTSYIYASLNDEFFDARHGAEGLYKPTALIAHTQGFIFGLEHYDEKKTMVLFVHGISGTPRDWNFMVEGLDRTRFQPFFFYYPSGLPLDKLGSLLARVIDGVNKGANKSQHKIVLVAHSMGGLVGLSAIHKLASEGLLSPVKMFVSFSTPYGGNDAARIGVDKAPFVVPAWRDIATGSEFIQRLNQQPFPNNLPFHLFFSYRDPSTFRLGESSDGVVALRSQLAPAIQSVAVKVSGINETHDRMLQNPAARGGLIQLLLDSAL